MAEIRGVVCDKPVCEQLQAPVAPWAKPDGRVIPVLKFRVETASGTVVQVFYKGETHGIIRLREEVVVRGIFRDGVFHAEYIYNDTIKSVVTAGRCCGCFVATAVYGSPMAEEVVLLRQYRDEVLGRSRSGRVLSTVYYLVGPLAARMIENNSPLRRIVRAALLAPLLSAVKKAMLDKNPTADERR